MNATETTLVEALLNGKHRALARVISKIENREPGYRDIVSELYAHTGHAEVVGITGSPGAGKSTLVDKLAKTYRDRGETVGVVAVDPSSPFTGGAVLGDRIRMASNVGDMDVFFRSMSARGNLGGLSTATADAVKALDAFGKDKILVETVGAGQNEIEIVRTADTVAVLVPPSSGDAVQMLKAGILEIGDVFVVNKADLDGADRTVQELREMIEMGGSEMVVGGGHHGFSEMSVDLDEERDWKPTVVETVATEAEGVDELIEALATHREYMIESGERERKARTRVAAEIRTLLRDDAAGVVERELDRQGGIDGFVDAVLAGETDPYTIADDVVAPLADCVDRRDDG